MRRALVMLAVLVAAAARGGDDAPRATGSLDGKAVTFPAKGLGDGVKATVGLLESCHDESLFDAGEFQKAMQADHIRLELRKPVSAEVMGKKVEFSELVFRRPLNTGVFWVRTGDGWRRFAKYEFKKQEPFEAWLKRAEPAK